MKKLIFYLAVVLLAFAGCKKYEEGPALSLRSKEKRLCQEWDEQKNLLNGEDNSYYDHQYWNFDKNGTLIITTAYDFPETEVTSNYNWRWTDNKESIEISIQIDKSFNNAKKNLIPFFKNTTTEWQELSIRKLKYEDLVFEYEEDGNLYRVELKQR